MKNYEITIPQEIVGLLWLDRIVYSTEKFIKENPTSELLPEKVELLDSCKKVIAIRKKRLK